MDKKISRRTAIQLGLGAAAGSVAGAAVPGTSTGDCTTPAQTEGPFYPKHQQVDKDADLTMVDGQTGAAKGEVIFVSGVVIDQSLKPVSGALVDVWQANTHGKYRHEDDPNTAPDDPQFQGWAQLRTDEDGRFGFKTIFPGAYPVDDSWWRPPHIHFKVAKRGYHELTTQMYFAGDKLNATDTILSELDEAERSRVVVEFAASDQHGGARAGHFNIMITKVVA
ncbi:MAG: protocatechuate 3,4-dioxygenase [Rhodothermales bacterium]|nr:protocatechuate 3,4-dioxygenase [Rhodothermales bacterium]